MDDASGRVATSSLGRESLAEFHRTVALDAGGGAWRRFRRFIGPGWLVAIGYMDPGNWATDLAAGSRFGYALLWVVFASGLVAMILQSLAVRLGVGSGRDLAQACAEMAPRWSRLCLWVLAEIGIWACDLAEVIGAAIALKLLFHLPLLAGVCLTTLDVALFLVLARGGVPRLEAAVAALLAVIAACLAVELLISQPAWPQALRGLIPSPAITSTPGALYVALGIVGATIMPHNLYLHSALVQTRRFPRTVEGRRTAIRFSALDSCSALAIAMLVNGAILVLAATVFHSVGRTDVAGIEDAYRLLTPLAGPLAAVLFAVALLAAGQSSSVTATLAGQVVMEGFVALRLAPWLRRLVTRVTAATPAILVIALWGEDGLANLLVGSQVLLSLQLPFAMVPLILLTSDRRRMGAFVNPPWLSAVSWCAAGAIIGLNGWLLAGPLLG